MSRFRGTTHIVEGSAEDVPRVLALLYETGFPPESPDLYARAYASFGVDEAREVVARAGTRAVAALYRVFIIATPLMTVEAQNALLKTLEEAPGGASFFLVVPNPDTLLPTVRSRSMPLSLARDAAHASADAFLRASPAERLDLLKPILDADERDLAGAYALLSDIERTLAPRATEQSVREGLAAVYRARAYLGDKGSLLKPLLEHVALLVPVV